MFRIPPENAKDFVVSYSPNSFLGANPKRKYLIYVVLLPLNKAILSGLAKQVNRYVVATSLFNLLPCHRFKARQVVH